MTRNEINNILNTMTRNDSYATQAGQQMANGFYRGVDMLAAIIKHLDKNGRHGVVLSAILSTYQSNERCCQSSPQQSANGLYRIVELLQLLIEIVAPDKKSAAQNIRNL